MDINNLETACERLRVGATLKLEGLTKEMKDISEGIRQLKQIYAIAEVEKLPTWKDCAIPNEDHLPEMDDDKFARCRAKISREKNLVVRMNAQIALVVAIHAIIKEKAERIKALNERIANSDGESNEVKAAKNLIGYIEDLIDVLERRMFSALGDYARTRKTVLRSINATTQKVVDMFPKANNKLAATFSGTSTNIANAICVLNTNDEQLRREQRAAVLGGLGRAKA